MQNECHDKLYSMGVSLLAALIDLDNIGVLWYVSFFYFYISKKSESYIASLIIKKYFKSTSLTVSYSDIFEGLILSYLKGENDE